MLRFLTAGESHGRALVSILEGIPAGLTIDFDALTAELRRRQGGYGRGRRMVIESDRADAISGVRHGVTTGAPIALMIPNKDWDNWQRTMAVEHPPAADTPGVDRAAVTRPRPGHVDLAGVVKYDHTDIRNVSSAPARARPHHEWPSVRSRGNSFSSWASPSSVTSSRLVPRQSATRLR